MDDPNYPGGGGGGQYGGPPDISTPAAQKNMRKPKRQAPQAAVAAFWDKFNTKYPGKVLTILPDQARAQMKAARTPHGAVKGQRAARSYEQARAECARDVDRIVRECRRINQKYRDPHFDIEWDLKSGRRNCLDGLSTCSEGMKPKGVGRVTDIFEKPQFYINGPTAGDVRQGRDGDCYFMAALCGLGNMKGEPLIHKVCVKHDQAVGVYGFVFFRDGEWQQTIVDDKLYLRAPDYEEAHEERRVWDEVNRADTEEEYRKAHQTGSRALYFAQCADENETWLPLLEKAYAKAHGDYSSIDGGFTGEALEDLTGGVTAEIYSTDILDRDAFWRDELLKVGKEFLFGCATGFYSNWLDPTGVAPPRERQGISEGHAYSIMDAVEIKGQRLLKLRNPWGKKEWDGRWSDGSSEWTAEWMAALDHKFGNDGIFWISYEDLLRKYQHFDRTRIFGDEWSVVQTWTAVNVPWTAEYLTTKFRVTLKEKSAVVIVLAQLDDTYFGGLQGGYGFDLQFRLEEDVKGGKGEESDYIVRSNGNYAMARSVSTDIELEAGSYVVLLKITAKRTGLDEVEDVLPHYAATRREKLIQMALSYDLAHAKGIIVENEKEKRERLEREKASKRKDREKLRVELKKQAEKDWKKRKAYYERDKKRRGKKERADEKRMAMGRAPRQPGSLIEENVNSLEVLDGDSERDAEEGATAPKQNTAREKDYTRAPAVPFRLRSFSGDAIPLGPKQSEEQTATEAGPDAEQDSIAAAVSGALSGPEPRKLTTPPSAEGIVQPLDVVLRQADATTWTPDEEEPDEQKPPTPKIQVNGVDAVTDVKPLPNKPPLSSLEHEGPTSTAIEPFAFAAAFNMGRHDEPERANANGAFENGHNEESDAKYPAPPPPQPRSRSQFADNPDPPASDTDSFPDFDWQTDLDMPSDSDSDADADVVKASRSRSRRRLRRRTRANNDTEAEAEADPNDNNNNNNNNDPISPAIANIEPWNAVCVVGLRVYSLLRGDGISVEVVRPPPDSDSDSDDELGILGGGGGGDDDDEEESAKKKRARENSEVQTLDRDDMNKGAAVAQAVGEPVEAGKGSGEGDVGEVDRGP